MIVLTSSTYSLVYFRCVSCKCPLDDPERKPNNSMVDRRVALNCDLHDDAAQKRFPLILPGYVIAYK